MVSMLGGGLRPREVSRPGAPQAGQEVDVGTAAASRVRAAYPGPIARRAGGPPAGGARHAVGQGGQRPPERLEVVGAELAREGRLVFNPGDFTASF
jgi:hypothetical protein